MLSHMSRFDLFKTHCSYPSSREGDLSGVALHPGFGTAGAGGLMHARAHGALIIPVMKQATFILSPQTNGGNLGIWPRRGQHENKWKNLFFL